MPTNDFLPFGSAVGANVISQADYAALAARSNGFSSGTAKSAQLNKAWRQASIMAAVLGQFIADQSGQNALDDGTTATLEASLLLAIRAAIRQPTILTDVGSANTYAASNAPALGAFPASGYSQRLNIANANTGPSTYSPDGLAPKPVYGLALQPLQGGELPVGVAVLMYLVQPGVNGGNGVWVILESAGGASQIAAATKGLHAVRAAQIQSQALTAFTTSGPSTAMTLSPSPAITTYAAGQRFCVTFSSVSTGSDTLNISGVGAKTLKQYDATGNKVAAVFASGQMSDVQYDGVDFVLLDPLPLNAQATETVTGSVKIATQSQVNAGADDASVVTPKKLRLGFSSLLTANGYLALPSWLGGFVFQWGTTSSFASDSTTYTTVFPTAFPTQCLTVVMNDFAVAGFSAVAKLNAKTASSFSASQIQVQGSSVSHQYLYFAIGY